MKERFVLTTATPLYTSILTDSSLSMMEAMSNGNGEAISKADAAALAFNSTIYEAIVLARNSEGVIKDYMFVQVLGFGHDTIKPLLPAPLNTDDFHPLSKIADCHLDVEDGRPVWIKPEGNGNTPMCQALDAAYIGLSQKVDQNPDGLPPTCMMFTDGEPTDGDPHEAAERIKAISTSNGPVTLFPVAISNYGGEPVSFPSSPDVLPDDYAKLLFEIASPLPDHMIDGVRQQGFELTPNSRAMVYNADASVLVKAFRAGTLIANPTVNAER